MDVISVELTSTTNADPDRSAWAARHFDTWYDVLAEGEALDRPDPATWKRGELRAVLEHGSTSELVHFVLASQDGEPVGVADVRFSLADNTHVATVHVVVRPAHRRRRIGTALFAHALDLAQAAGRTSVRIGVDRPSDQEESTWPGAVAARRWGFAKGQVDARRQLALPVAPGRVDALREQALPFATGYAVRSFAGAVPEPDLEALAHLNSRMSTDAPMGDLEIEPEIWTGERLRELEALRAAQGRHQWVAVAESSTGELVAYTVIVRSDHEPERLLQLDTLVLREHRGHRLGMLVKLECLRAAVAANPAAQRISTWNAVSNTPMIAVNQALGFELDELIAEFEAPLADLRQTLHTSP